MDGIRGFAYKLGVLHNILGSDSHAEQSVVAILDFLGKAAHPGFAQKVMTDHDRDGIALQSPRFLVCFGYFLGKAGYLM